MPIREWSLRWVLGPALGMVLAGCYQNPDPFDAERQQSLAGGQSAASQQGSNQNDQTLMDRQREQQLRDQQAQRQQREQQDAQPDATEQTEAELKAAKQSARRTAAAAARNVPRPVSLPTVQLPSGGLLGR